MKSKILMSTLAIAAASTMSLPAAIAADDAQVSITGDAYRWEVDMRGRPPFKRERVPVGGVIDLASMETVTKGETVVVWERSHRGRPPFKRERAEVMVVDGASMELNRARQNETQFRGRPPFKRHR